MKQLAEHLRFYQELGVTGVSRDAKWRRRDDMAGLMAGTTSDIAGLKTGTTSDIAGLKAGTTTPESSPDAAESDVVPAFRPAMSSRRRHFASRLIPVTPSSW